MRESYLREQSPSLQMLSGTWKVMHQIVQLEQATGATWVRSAEGEESYWFYWFAPASGMDFFQVKSQNLFPNPKHFN